MFQFVAQTRLSGQRGEEPREMRPPGPKQMQASDEWGVGLCRYTSTIRSPAEASGIDPPC